MGHKKGELKVTLYVDMYGPNYNDRARKILTEAGFSFREQEASGYNLPAVEWEFEGYENSRESFPFLDGVKLFVISFDPEDTFDGLGANDASEL